MPSWTQLGQLPTTALLAGASQSLPSAACFSACHRGPEQLLCQPEPLNALAARPFGLCDDCAGLASWPTLVRLDINRYLFFFLFFFLKNNSLFLLLQEKTPLSRYTLWKCRQVPTMPKTQFCYTDCICEDSFSYQWKFLISVSYDKKWEQVLNFFFMITVTLL